MSLFSLANPFFGAMTRVELWKYPERWPQDALGLTFAPRGIVLLGGFLEPDWTGEESAVDHQEPIPIRNMVGTCVDHHRYAAKLLLEVYDGYQKRCLGLGADSTSIRLPWNGLDPMPNDDEWERAYQESIRRAAITGPQFDRYAFVCATAIVYLQRGILRSFGRAMHGGEFTQIPPSNWVGENLQHRFDLGRFDPSKPFDRRAADYGATLIFFDRAEIEALGLEIQRYRNAAEKAAGLVAASKEQVEAFYKQLVEQMKGSPEAKPQPKTAFQRWALEQFGVGPRKFSECWQAAIAESGAKAWSRSGAPKRSRESKPQSEHNVKS